ncbi:MAG TPA: ABC transporter ATP-binding protein, partial [Bacillota bacterium]|nr:ABC transporter ATP-binding protein [Bacillota bacterium]
MGRYAAKAWPALAAFAGLVVVGTLSGLVVPWVQQDLLNGVLHGGVTGRVWALLGAWAALAVLGQAAGAGGRLLRTRVDLRLGVLGRADAYRHVLALPHVEVAGRGTSQVLSDLDYAADATGVPTMVIEWVVGLGTRVIGASGALLLLSGPVLLASAPFVLGYVVLPRVLARWIRSAERAEQETRTEVRAVVLDQVEGMRDVRLFGAGSWALGRLHAAWLQSVRAAWRTAVAHGGSDTLNWALRTGAYLAAWAVGLHDVQAGRLGAGGLLAITLYLGALFDPLDRVLSLQYHWIGWMLDVDRTIALQRRSAGEAFGAPRGVGPQAADGSIQVDGLEVRYPGQERSALRLRAFRVDSGETVALVGPNGSGKSTLLACLLDLVRPVRGRIRHGGAPLGEIREDALR